ncbi:MAG: phage portal protein [Tabrizicola sp.]|uniref:phage portal protein n=1 Tax=Tabrizicola sp. TaxID=2005166 RepID=UPI00273713C7|nr:phage portal protein [Tabrizicola sp.]MDP3263471.1 phage portal protein [Tabrizicola sp.]MDP3646828.1 phage portal protein [Paracoccaceae bacterium]MDZ4069058.1 phage portal protein [Tabrizicola sp.]
MSIFSRIFGKAEPARTRRFDGATGGRRGVGMGTFGRINPETAAAGPAIRSRASHLAMNAPFISNAVGNWVGALIGPGIQPAARHPDAATRNALNQHFSDWCNRADAERRTDFAGLQVAVANSLVVAGEAVALISDMADGPRIRVLPVEMLDESKTLELSGGRSIFSGVELDATGCRVAYWIVPERPGQAWQTYAPSVRVEADSVLHVVKPLAAGQLRGVSWLAPIILPAGDLDRLCDALLKGAQVSAMMAGFIIDQSGTGDPLNNEETPSLEPGALVRLPSGTDIKFNSPQQAQQMGEFIKLNLRQLAAGLGLPDHMLSGDLTGANYSSLRAGLLPFRQRVEQVQYTVLVPQFLAPVWRAVILHGILSGDLEAPDFEANPEAYLQADWLPPRPLQVDPLKDISATKAELEAGLTSRRKAVAERGWILEDLDAEIEAERGTVAKDKDSENGAA